LVLRRVAPEKRKTRKKLGWIEGSAFDSGVSKKESKT